MSGRCSQLGSTPYKYGSNCCRSSPVHFIEFYHPGGFVFPSHVLKHFANLSGDFHSVPHRWQWFPSASLPQVAL